MMNGVCDDCGHEIQIGEWPYDCGNIPTGHLILTRLMYLGKGRTKEYDAPMPINPMNGPQITREWLNPDGSTRPMAPDEYNNRFVGMDA